MKTPRFSRRRLFLGALGAIPVGIVAHAGWLEPRWLKIRRIRLAPPQAHALRVLHFTDLHHKGDRDLLFKVVRKINELKPDLVCFTGDLIEEREHLAETLEILAEMKHPLYGVPGNHDYWAQVPFEGIARCFASTGGGWLLDEQRMVADGKWSLYGATCLGAKGPPIRINPNTRNLLLIHYPAWVKRVDERFDLVLAGHSHGGQVRIPWIGPLMLPFGVEGYDQGLFETAVGPLYVNPGIGWFAVPIRFNCRPELTMFEV